MTQPTDIHAIAFFAADHAVVAGGKVFVNGGFWTRLNFATFPQVLPVGLVAVLNVPFRAYHQDHRLEIGLEDADGRELRLRVEGDFRVGAGPDMKYGDPTVMPVAVMANSVMFEKPGDYSFVLKVDGTELTRYSVRAVQVAAPILPGAIPPPPSGQEPPPQD